MTKFSSSYSWTAGTGAFLAPKPADPLADGLAAHRGGQLDQAIAHYVRALSARPNRAAACYNLGVAYIGASMGLTSFPFLMRAVLLQPTVEPYPYALLYGLLRTGRLARAADHVDECERQGLAAATLVQWRQWLAACLAGQDAGALGLPSPLPVEPRGEPPDRAPDAPTSSPIHGSLAEPFAQALQAYDAGRAQGSVDVLSPLVARYPEWGEGHHLLGLAFAKLDDVQQGAEQMGRAASIVPGRPELWDHLGTVLVSLGDHDGVRTAYERALSLNPLRPESWNNAASAALTQERFAEAYQYALQALRLKPDLFESYYCLARAAEGLEDREGAVRLFSHLLQVEPNFSTPELQPSILGALASNQRYACDWTHWQERVPTLRDRIRSGERAIDPFMALSLPGLTPADQLRIARGQADRFAPWSHRALPPRRTSASGARSRLRVAYLSADFRQHPMAFLTASLFELHDRERFEVFAYSCGPDDSSAIRRRLMEAFEHFIDIRDLTHTAAAQRIRDDDIDILVDLSGYTAGGRPEILAMRPAPIQVSWIGYPGTMGVPFMDYIVVDPVIVAPDEARHYDEKLAYMPDSYFPVDFRRSVAPMPTRAQAGLPDDGFVFCGFNNPYKLTPDIFDIWCSLLKSVPEAVLWLYSNNESVTRNLAREAAARGIGSERLAFAAPVSQDQHLARVALADLFLDTLPYNGHTTASDALWVNVPVITCPGDTFVSRVAASLLNASALPDLVVSDLDEYRERAHHLAAHPGALTAMKQRLLAAHDRAPYFDTERFTRNLEALYRRMWARHEAGLPPALLPPEQARYR